MTILHGDARFYNNIFVQKEIRPDLVAYAEAEGMGTMDKYQFICGNETVRTDIPRQRHTLDVFNAETAVDHDNKDIYYDHLPIYTGGNVYFNGAKTVRLQRKIIKWMRNTRSHWELKEEGANTAWRRICMNSFQNSRPVCEHGNAG